MASALWVYMVVYGRRGAVWSCEVAAGVLGSRVTAGPVPLVWKEGDRLADGLQ